MDVLLVSNVCLFKTCDVYFFFNEKEAVPALLNNSVRQLLLFWEVSDTGRNLAPLKMLNLFLWWWNNIMNMDEEFLRILKRCLTFVSFFGFCGCIGRQVNHSSIEDTTTDALF